LAETLFKKYGNVSEHNTEKVSKPFTVIEKSHKSTGNFWWRKWPWTYLMFSLSVCKLIAATLLIWQETWCS